MYFLFRGPYLAHERPCRPRRQTLSLTRRPGCHGDARALLGRGFGQGERHDGELRSYGGLGGDGRKRQRKRRGGRSRLTSGYLWREAIMLDFTFGRIFGTVFLLNWQPDMSKILFFICISKNILQKLGDDNVFRSAVKKVCF